MQMGMRLLMLQTQEPTTRNVRIVDEPKVKYIRAGIEDIPTTGRPMQDIWADYIQAYKDCGFPMAITVRDPGLTKPVPKTVSNLYQLRQGVREEVGHFESEELKEMQEYAAELELARKVEEHRSIEYWQEQWRKEDEARARMKKAEQKIERKKKLLRIISNLLIDIDRHLPYMHEVDIAYVDRVSGLKLTRRTSAKELKEYKKTLSAVREFYIDWFNKSHLV